jgi:CRP/FNR family transcriptional regulator
MQIVAAASDLDFREFARAVGTLRDCGVGEVLFSEGDAARFMYVLLSGSVEIYSRGILLQTLAAGEAFGIVSLLDGQERTAKALVTTPSQVAELDRKKLRYMIDEVPHFCRYVIGELAHRLRAINSAV